MSFRKWIIRKEHGIFNSLAGHATTGKVKQPNLDPCVYCGESANTWEHVTPKVSGGRDIMDNRARACLDCNQKRSSKPLLQWLLELKRKKEYKHGTEDSIG